MRERERSKILSCRAGASKDRVVYRAVAGLKIDGANVRDRSIGWIPDNFWLVCFRFTLLHGVFNVVEGVFLLVSVCARRMGGQGGRENGAGVDAAVCKKCDLCIVVCV